MSTRPSLEEIMGRKMQRAHPPLSLIKKRRRTRLATILICGSPADGFQIIGLFADRDDAQSYAEDYSLKHRCIAELTSPTWDNANVYSAISTFGNSLGLPIIWSRRMP